MMRAVAAPRASARMSSARSMASRVGLAVLLAVASFSLYSCFDLLGRRYTGHTLGTVTVMTVTFVAFQPVPLLPTYFPG